MWRNSTNALLLGLVLFVSSGCSTTAPPGRPDELDRVYDEVHGKGSADTVQLLREGMRERKVYGYTDPYIPVRNPEDVRKIWVPDSVDPVTGRLVHGHWESTVLKEGSWFID